MQEDLEVKAVTLNDGNRLFFTDRLHEDETGIAGGVAPRLVIENTSDIVENPFEDFPGLDSEYSHRQIFDTLLTYELIIKSLINLGHLDQDRYVLAREFALKQV